MASNVQQSSIATAARYWFEQIPYTDTYESLGGSGSANAGNRQNVFSLQGWTPSTAPTIYTELTAVGATPQVGLQLQVNADKDQIRLDLGAWPGRLRPVDLRHGGIRNLSADLVNTTSSTLTNQQLTYLLSVWKMPISFKILRGFPLTPQEQALARAAQVSPNPVTARGTLPYTWATVIAETYANRQLDPTGQFAQTQTVTATSTPIHHVQARPNQLLILRAIGATAPFGSGTVLTVDRDDDANHVELRLDGLRGDPPMPMFIPALDHLTFAVSAADPPAGPLPIRIEIWTVALSLLLSVRLGLVSEADLQSLLGAKDGAHRYAMIQAGRI